MKKNKYYKYIIMASILFGHKNIYAKPNNCTQELDHFKCLEFVSNYDGDTATYNIPNIHPLFGKKLNISLKDIKTPAIYSRNDCEKKIAKKVKIEVRKLLRNAKFIEVRNIIRDKRFALKGDIYIDGKSLTDRLLKNKMAVPSKIYKETNWCNIS